MNYLLTLGLILFSSGTGALIVSLVHLARTQALRGAPESESETRNTEAGRQ